MYAIGTDTIIVLNIKSGQYKKVKTADFVRCERNADPVRVHSYAFKCHLPPLDGIVITASTKPPVSRKQAQRYPDSEKWGQAHNAELDKLHDKRARKWLPDVELPSRSKLIPMNMGYRYKSTPEGALKE